jgi:hypothetical protein
MADERILHYERAGVKDRAFYAARGVFVVLGDVAPNFENI